jgi:IMP dehydrogenase/GMP reductase
MDPIKEALTFDDVTLAPKYSEILPSEVDTSIKLTENLKIKNSITFICYGHSYRKQDGHCNR